MWIRKSPTGESREQALFADAGHPTTRGFGAAKSKRADLGFLSKSEALR